MCSRRKLLRYLLILGVGVVTGELLAVVFAFGVTVLVLGVLLALLWAGEVPPRDAY